jgi:hypothetical protein
MNRDDPDRVTLGRHDVKGLDRLFRHSSLLSMVDA